MRILRKPILLVLCFLLVLPLTASAVTEQSQAIVRDLVGYYFHYREEAAPEIDNQLQTLSSLAPQEGELWGKVMDRWRWINEDMTLNFDCLPDGLPEDDSLCIVVLGFGLNSNGSMKPELISRLETVLCSAEKYPESYVLCTGGETSRVRGVSEAGQMGKWLLEHGLEEHRLILEPASYSTTENAKNSLKLLGEEYPNVMSLALVTSDYHIPWGYTCFTAEALCREYRRGAAKVELVGNAACATETPDRDTMYSQAWGICLIADIPFNGDYVPTLYMTEEPEPTEAPAEIRTVTEDVSAQPEDKEPVLPVLLALGAAMLIVFIPKNRKSGSD